MTSKFKEIRWEVLFMERYFFKPVLANPSLGARITYLMKLRGYSDDNMAEYFGWGGDDPVETMRKYKNNNRVPGKERLEKMANYLE